MIGSSSAVEAVIMSPCPLDLLAGPQGTNLATTSIDAYPHMLTMATKIEMGERVNRSLG